jgi:putative endonuclease
MSRTYHVYILASRSRTLYTGVTNNLERRITEHRHRLAPGFTGRYNVFRLVYLEAFSDIRAAIAREKEIKGWRREKKIWLIHRSNRAWEDLGEQLFKRTETGKPKADPSPPSPKTGAGSG